jgi:hypothetical protein
MCIVRVFFPILAGSTLGLSGRASVSTNCESEFSGSMNCDGGGSSGLAIFLAGNNAPLDLCLPSSLFPGRSPNWPTNQKLGRKLWASYEVATVRPQMPEDRTRSGSNLSSRP